MSSFNRIALTDAGFEGFSMFDELRQGAATPSDNGSVYAVVRVSAVEVAFLDANPGGRFKQRDPTVAAEVLAAKWVEGSDVVYSGKADNLRRRLKQYADFGAGKPIGHWGGRYIWQLADSAELLVA